MNCWPKAFDSSGAIARARISVVPAAGNGTMIFTGRVGQLFCANAGKARNAADAAPAPSTRRRLESKLRFTPSSRSVGVHAGGLDDRAPLGDFGCDELL